MTGDGDYDLNFIIIGNTFEDHPYKNIDCKIDNNLSSVGFYSMRLLVKKYNPSKNYYFDDDLKTYVYLKEEIKHSIMGTRSLYKYDDDSNLPNCDNYLEIFRNSKSITNELKLELNLPLIPKIDSSEKLDNKKQVSEDCEENSSECFKDYKYLRDGNCYKSCNTDDDDFVYTKMNLIKKIWYLLI